MGLFPAKFNLPDDATVKDISNFKKRVNWGDIPAFFHLVANSIAEVEGFIHYGFDNAYKRITNKNNWNFDKLGLPEGVSIKQMVNLKDIQPLTRPELCLYHVFSPQGYELLAFPYVKDVIVDQYLSGEPEMDFKVWDPSDMKVLVRITQFHKFMGLCINNGDDADLALIIHAHNVVNRMISMLEQELDISQKGMTIREAYKLQNANPDMDPDEVIIATQVEDELSKQD